MQCPVCDVTLSISSREGVEIDFCPQCRGVWLDRGELDKVIERAGEVLAAARRARPDDRPDDRYDERPRREERYDERPRHDDDRPRYDRSQERSYDRPPPHRKKKKGFDFLEDIFDLG